MIEQRVGVVEHPVGEPIVAHELPDVLLRVQFWALRRQRHDGDVVRHLQLAGEMPTSLVEQQHRMTAGGNVVGDRREVQVHRRRIAPGQDQPDGLAFPWTDGAEDIGRDGALVRWRRGTAATPGPAAGDLVLLSDPGFVAEPDLYAAGIDATPVRDRRQWRRPVFLKASTAPAFCAWWRGRADSLR